MIKISIIVPVYKTAMYLRRCLDSCVYQTLRDIEVIVVNDASPDQSDAEIMREYEQTYPNIVKCIYLNENLKQGGARNKGIEAAKGEYVLFVDSDDYIDFTMCQKLYEQIDDQNADLVYCDAYICKLGNIYVLTQAFSEADNKSEYLTEHFGGVFLAAWTCMVRRSFIISNNLYFPEHIFYEDNAITPLWYIKAQNIKKVDLPLYFFMIRKTSTTQTPSVEKMFMLIEMADHLIKSSKCTGVYESYYLGLHLLMLHHIRSNLHFEDRDVYEMCKPYISDWCVKLSEVFELDLSKFEGCELRSVKRMKIFAEFIAAKTHTLEDYDKYVKKDENFRKDCFIELYNSLPKDKKRVCIWGAGANGTELSKSLAGVDVDLNYTDKSPSVHGKIMPDGRRVKSWDDVKDITDAIIVCTSNHYKSIKEMVGDKYLLIDYERYSNGECSAELFIEMMGESLC